MERRKGGNVHLAGPILRTGVQFCVRCGYTLTDYRGAMAPTAEEWVLVADRDTGATIIRSGFQTAREAGLVRAELEARMADDDSTNLLILTRRQSRAFLADANKVNHG